jgi:hypothetical protein
MIWFRIRKATIDPELRAIFERYGVIAMQSALANFGSGAGALFDNKEGSISIEKIREPLFQWLTEQYDRAERKETWSITMEASITFLVLIEAIPVVITFLKWLHWMH